MIEKAYGDAKAIDIRRGEILSFQKEIVIRKAKTTHHPIAFI